MNENLERAKEIYMDNHFSESEMLESGTYDEYEEYNVPTDLEKQWQEEYFNKIIETIKQLELPRDQDKYTENLRVIGKYNRYMQKEKIIELLNIIANFNNQLPVFFQLLGYNCIISCLVQKEQSKNSEEKKWILEAYKFLKNKYQQIKLEIDEMRKLGMIDNIAIYDVSRKINDMDIRINSFGR